MDGGGFGILDIVLLAAVAGFLILRLRNVLGRRNGHEESRPTFDPFRKDKPEDKQEDTVIQLPDRGRRDGAKARAERASDQGSKTKAPETPLDAALTQIQLADRNFEPDGFTTGAKAAFEMIITAFAAGDTQTLRPLLSNDVYDDFSGAIKGRLDAKEALETTLIGIDSAEIIEAELQGKTAFVTTKFISQQVNVTRDAAGEIVDGDPSQVTSITDIWTFARNTRSRDPNWTLVATRSSN